MAKTLDEIMAENSTLNSELATAKQNITNLTAQVGALTTERDAAKASLVAANSTITAMTSERDILKAANVKLDADMKDFNAKVAAEVAKHGINPKAASAEKTSEQKGKLTLTEQCLAAKGLPLDYLVKNGGLDLIGTANIQA